MLTLLNFMKATPEIDMIVISNDHQLDIGEVAHEPELIEELFVQGRVVLHCKEGEPTDGITVGNSVPPTGLFTELIVYVEPPNIFVERDRALLN